MEEIKSLLIKGTCWELERDRIREIERKYYVIGYRFIEGRGGIMRIVFKDGKPKRKKDNYGRR